MDQRIRYTCHLRKSILDKLRDVIFYVQKHPDEFRGQVDLLNSVSRFVEVAVLEKIIRMEKERGEPFAVRAEGEEVNHGRPPIVMEIPNDD